MGSIPARDAGQAGVPSPRPSLEQPARRAAVSVGGERGHHDRGLIGDKRALESGRTSGVLASEQLPAAAEVWKQVGKVVRGSSGGRRGACGRVGPRQGLGRVPAKQLDVLGRRRHRVPASRFIAGMSDCHVQRGCLGAAATRAADGARVGEGGRARRVGASRRHHSLPSTGVSRTILDADGSTRHMVSTSERGAVLSPDATPISTRSAQAAIEGRLCFIFACPRAATNTWRSAAMMDPGFHDARQIRWLGTRRCRCCAMDALATRVCGHRAPLARTATRATRCDESPSSCDQRRVPVLLLSALSPKHGG